MTFSLPAINAPAPVDGPSEEERAAISSEAQVAQLEQLYKATMARHVAATQQTGEDALRTLGHVVEAFRQILADPLVAGVQGSTAALGPFVAAAPVKRQQLLYLAQRNLGVALASAPGPIPRAGFASLPEQQLAALHCLLAAASMDSGDVVLWHRAGTLASSLGRLHLARQAFEQGLRTSPGHWLCREGLLRALVDMGDEIAAASLARGMLREDPHCRVVREALAWAVGPAGGKRHAPGCEWSLEQEQGGNAGPRSVRADRWPLRGGADGCRVEPRGVGAGGRLMGVGGEGRGGEGEGDGRGLKGAGGSCGDERTGRKRKWVMVVGVDLSEGEEEEEEGDEEEDEGQGEDEEERDGDLGGGRLPGTDREGARGVVHAGIVADVGTAAAATARQDIRGKHKGGPRASHTEDGAKKVSGTVILGLRELSWEALCGALVRRLEEGQAGVGTGNRGGMGAGGGMGDGGIHDMDSFIAGLPGGVGLGSKRPRLARPRAARLMSTGVVFGWEGRGPPPCPALVHRWIAPWVPGPGGAMLIGAASGAWASSDSKVASQANQVYGHGQGPRGEGGSPGGLGGGGEGAEGDDMGQARGAGGEEGSAGGATSPIDVGGNLPMSEARLSPGGDQMASGLGSTMPARALSSPPGSARVGDMRDAPMATIDVLEAVSTVTPVDGATVNTAPGGVETAAICTATATATTVAATTTTATAAAVTAITTAPATSARASGPDPAVVVAPKPDASAPLTRRTLRSNAATKDVDKDKEKEKEKERGQVPGKGSAASGQAKGGEGADAGGHRKNDVACIARLVEFVSLPVLLDWDTTATTVVADDGGKEGTRGQEEAWVADDPQHCGGTGEPETSSDVQMGEVAKGVAGRTASQGGPGSVADARGVVRDGTSGATRQGEGEATGTRHAGAPRSLCSRPPSADISGDLPCTDAMRETDRVAAFLLRWASTGDDNCGAYHLADLVIRAVCGNDGRAGGLSDPTRGLTPGRGGLSPRHGAAPDGHHGCAVISAGPCARVNAGLGAGLAALHHDAHGHETPRGPHTFHRHQAIPGQHDAVDLTPAAVARLLQLEALTRGWGAGADLAPWGGPAASLWFAEAHLDRAIVLIAGGDAGAGGLDAGSQGGGHHGHKENSGGSRRGGAGKAEKGGPRPGTGDRGGGALGLADPRAMSAQQREYHLHQAARHLAQAKAAMWAGGLIAPGTPLPSDRVCGAGAEEASRYAREQGAAADAREQGPGRPPHAGAAAGMEASNSAVDSTELVVGSPRWAFHLRYHWTAGRLGLEGGATLAEGRSHLELCLRLLGGSVRGSTRGGQGSDASAGGGQRRDFQQGAAAGAPQGSLSTRKDPASEDSSGAGADGGGRAGLQVPETCDDAPDDVAEGGDVPGVVLRLGHCVNDGEISLSSVTKRLKQTGLADLVKRVQAMLAAAAAAAEVPGASAAGGASSSSSSRRHMEGGGAEQGLPSEVAANADNNTVASHPFSEGKEAFESDVEGEETGGAGEEGTEGRSKAKDDGGKSGEAGLLPSVAREVLALLSAPVLKEMGQVDLADPRWPRPGSLEGAADAGMASATAAPSAYMRVGPPSDTGGVDQGGVSGGAPTGAGVAGSAGGSVMILPASPAMVAFEDAVGLLRGACEQLGGAEARAEAADTETRCLDLMLQRALVLACGPWFCDSLSPWMGRVKVGGGGAGGAQGGAGGNRRVSLASWRARLGVVLMLETTMAEQGDAWVPGTEGSWGGLPEGRLRQAGLPTPWDPDQVSTAGKEYREAKRGARMEYLAGPSLGRLLLWMRKSGEAVLAVGTRKTLAKPPSPLVVTSLLAGLTLLLDRCLERACAKAGERGAPFYTSVPPAGGATPSAVPRRHLGLSLSGPLVIARAAAAFATWHAVAVLMWQQGAWRPEVVGGTGPRVEWGCPTREANARLLHTLHMLTARGRACVVGGAPDGGPGLFPRTAASIMWACQGQERFLVASSYEGVATTPSPCSATNGGDVPRMPAVSIGGAAATVQAAAGAGVPDQDMTLQGGKVQSEGGSGNPQDMVACPRKQKEDDPAAVTALVDICHCLYGVDLRSLCTLAGPRKACSKRGKTTAGATTTMSSARSLVAGPSGTPTLGAGDRGGNGHGGYLVRWSHAGGGRDNAYDCDDSDGDDEDDDDDDFQDGGWRRKHNKGGGGGGGASDDAAAPPRVPASFPDLARLLRLVLHFRSPLIETDVGSQLQEQVEHVLEAGVVACQEQAGPALRSNFLQRLVRYLDEDEWPDLAAPPPFPFQQVPVWAGVGAAVADSFAAGPRVVAPAAAGAGAAAEAGLTAAAPGAAAAGGAITLGVTLGHTAERGPGGQGVRLGVDVLGRPLEGARDPRVVTEFPDVLSHVHDMYNRMCDFNAESDLESARWLNDPSADHGVFTKVIGGLLHDLCYHPFSYHSWLWLASAYDTAIDVILNDASKQLAPCDWAGDGGVRARTLANYRRRCVRSGMMALRLASRDMYTDALERYTPVLYDGLTCEPPMFDFGKQSMRRRERGWDEMLEYSVRFVKEAMACSPTKWNHPYLLGKLMQKQRPCRTSWDSQGITHLQAVLRTFIEAAKLAKDQLEPIYRLHATRLKALMSPTPLPLAALEVLFYYMFLGGKKMVSNPARLREMLFWDCVAAMNFCLSKRPHFHKARYRLALAFSQHGNVDAALTELSFFFRSSNKFGIRFWEITDKDKRPRPVKGGKRKRGGHHQKSNAAAATGPVDAAEASQEEPPRADGVLGDLVIRSIGLEESSRKFVCYLRKSLALFLSLLFVEGDVAQLEAMHAGLVANDKFKRSTRDIASLTLGAYLTSLVAALTDADAHASSKAATSTNATATTSVTPARLPSSASPPPTHAAHPASASPATASGRGVGTTPFMPKSPVAEAARAASTPAVTQAAGPSPQDTAADPDPAVLTQAASGALGPPIPFTPARGPHQQPITLACPTATPNTLAGAQGPRTQEGQRAGTQAEPIVLSQDPAGEGEDAQDDEVVCLGATPPPAPGSTGYAPRHALPREALLGRSFAAFVKHCLPCDQSRDTAAALAGFLVFVATGARGMLTERLRACAVAVVDRALTGPHTSKQEEEELEKDEGQQQQHGQQRQQERGDTRARAPGAAAMSGSSSLSPATMVAEQPVGAGSAAVGAGAPAEKELAGAASAAEKEANAAIRHALFHHALAHLGELACAQAVDELATCLSTIKQESRQCEMVTHGHLHTLWLRCTAALASALKAQLAAEEAVVASARISGAAAGASSGPGPLTSTEASGAALAGAAGLADEGPLEMATEAQQQGAHLAMPSDTLQAVDSDQTKKTASKATSGSRACLAAATGDATKAAEVTGGALEPSAVQAEDVGTKQDAAGEGALAIMAPAAGVTGVTSDSWSRLTPKERRRLLLQSALTLYKDASNKAVFKPAAASNKAAMVSGASSDRSGAAGLGGGVTQGALGEEDAVTDGVIQDLLRQAYGLETEKPCRDADISTIVAYCEDRFARKTGGRKGN
eukprot:jgi/Mesvir1/8799/Mv02703-RA.1